MAKQTRSSPAASKKKTGSRRKPAAAREPFANYQAAVRYLMAAADVERMRASRVDPSVFTLDRMRALMKALGNPENELRAVHVAGTNGKGSVVAMAASCLRECGYTVGEYTSPHLTDLRERIRINDAPIPHAIFSEQLHRVARAADSLPKRLGQPTYFELMTAVMFLHLAEQAVDVAIIEVGLGGRLDATNVLSPEITAVTRIDLDHRQFLGDSHDAIAREKAGVFKPDVPALTIEQEKTAAAALREVAEDVGAPFEVVGDEIEFSYRFESSPQLGPHTRVGLSTDRNVFEHVPVPLPGEHQALNCGLALAILDKLSGRGFELPEAEVIEGLARTRVPGRMEMAWREPRILLDGAHNPAALAALVRSIGAHVPYDSMVMVFGCSADKDWKEMLARIGAGADKVIFTRAKNNPRAADPDDLAAAFQEDSSKMCQVAPALDEALSIAVRAAGRDDLIVVTGSFFLVGEAKKHLASRAERHTARA